MGQIEELDKMKYLVLLAGLFLMGCVSSKHISDSENAWVSDRVLFSDTYYYCMANKDTNNGTAKPVCFEAGIINQGDKVKRK